LIIQYKAELLPALEQVTSHPALVAEYPGSTQYAVRVAPPLLGVIVNLES